MELHANNGCGHGRCCDCGCAFVVLCPLANIRCIQREAASVGGLFHFNVAVKTADRNPALVCLPACR
jgi:hypothetical protein